jgi:hypothetical protein
MTKPLFRSCPRCEASAARPTPWLPPSERRRQLEFIAYLCHDPRHIDLEGKARDPGNLPKVTFVLDAPVPKRRKRRGG